jgi:hypothetical protein
MDCITPTPLSDDELFAALDGEATTETLHHLEQCEHCAAKLERVRKFEESIQTVMHRADCPSNDALTEYLLAGEKDKRVERHLETCIRCQEEVRLLRAVFVVGEAQTNHHSAVASLWQKAKDFVQSVEEQFVQILLPQPTLVYGQLKGTEGSRVLSFAVGSVSVMLSLEKIADGLKINGTIVDSESDDKWRDAKVELTGLTEAQKRYVGTVDDLETFTFDYILPGTFSLSIYAVSGQVLRLPKVELVP